MNIGIIGGIIAFLALMFFLPSHYRFYLWIPYGIILSIVIIKSNKILAKIRQEESNKK